MHKEIPQNTTNVDTLYTRTLIKKCISEKWPQKYQISM